MGYIGLFVLVPCFPYAAYLAYHVRNDLTASIMGCIAIKGLLDFVLTDYLLFRSVILTSATTATVGLGLTIPLAFVADLIFQPEEKSVISLYSVIGAVSVGAGFLSVLDMGGEVVKEEEVVVKEEVTKNYEEQQPTTYSSSSSEGEPTSCFVILPGPSWTQL